MRTARLFPALVPLLVACGGSPPPAPNPAGEVARAAPAASESWSFFSDLERLDRLAVTGSHVYGVTPLGVVRWERTSGAFTVEAGEGAPGPGTSAVAVAPDGALYAGLPSGLAWRAPRAPGWSRTSVGPLGGGVTALAPRAQGGVWVGMARGLGWFDADRLHVVSDRHRVRGLVVATDGRVWAATDGHGVLDLGERGESIVEHTSGQGLCGNHVGGLVAGPGGLAALCLDSGAGSRFSVWRESRWTTYIVSGLGATVEAVVPLADALIVRAGGAEWRAEPLPAPPPEQPPVAPTGPVAEAAQAPVTPEPPPTAQPEPAPATAAIPPGEAHGAPVAAVAPPAGEPAVAADASPATSTPPGAGGLGAELSRALTPGKAPAEAAPPPAAAAPPPPPPAVVAASLPVRRAAPPASPPGRSLGLQRLDAVLPRGATVTAQAVSPDGTAWFAVANQGVFAVRGAERRRFLGAGLQPAGEVGRLVVDRRGRAFVAPGGNRLFGWSGGRWETWRVSDEPALDVLGVAVDEFDQTWAVAWHPDEPRMLRVLRAPDDGRFVELGRAPLPELEGPPRAGRIFLDARGNLLFPLFWVDGQGRYRGAGLAHVPNTLDRVEVWKASLYADADDEEEGAAPAGPPNLPDAWVNVVVKAPAGDVTYLGTNAGLARYAGGRLKVFDENDFIESEVVLDVALDRLGRVWVATLEGLGHLAADRWSAVTQPGLSGRVNAVAVDTEGTVWVASEAGLYRGDGARFERVEAAGIVPGAVRDVAVDGLGAVWLLTSDGIARRAPPGAAPPAAPRPSARHSD